MCYYFSHYQILSHSPSRNGKEEKENTDTKKYKENRNEKDED